MTIYKVPQNTKIIQELAFTQQRIEAHVKQISEILMNIPNIPWYKRQVDVSNLSFFVHKRCRGKPCVCPRTKTGNKPMSTNSVGANLVFALEQKPETNLCPQTV